MIPMPPKATRELFVRDVEAAVQIAVLLVRLSQSFQVLPVKPGWNHFKVPRECRIREALPGAFHKHVVEEGKPWSE